MTSHHKPNPSYRLHRQSGQAIVTLVDSLGNRRDVLLGRYDTEASHQEYRRVLAEWNAAGRQLLPRTETKTQDLTINELILGYWHHVETYYRHPDGSPTSEQDNIKQALKPLRQLYGHTSANKFDALSLEAIRQHRIEAGYARKRINKDVSRIKAVFKWAAARKLVPSTVWNELAALEGLRRGRSDARETEPVKPVAAETVEQTLPFLLPPTQAMVRLLLLTGMRPGEVCAMRTMDLDVSGKVWLYTPGSDQGEHGQHKTAWRGQSRIIMIGPKAQAVLKPWLRTVLSERIFQPRDAVTAWQAVKRVRRKSKVQPSQLCRTKPKPKRRPGTAYQPRAFSTAVRRACEKAGVPPWHPNQLRHTAATLLRREAGVDIARTVLGHESKDATLLYAEADRARAEAIIERIG